MESEILKMAISQGIWCALFVALFFYMLRENSKRERGYQNIITKLTDKYEGLREELQTLVTKLDTWTKR